MSTEHPKTNALALRSGYRVACVEGRDGGDELWVTAPDGTRCLTVQLTAAGPVVDLQSVALRLSAQEEIRLECETLDVRAERGLSLRAGGDLVQSAGGDMTLSAEGALCSEAFSQHHVAAQGRFVVEANDDVVVEGERIGLNSRRSGRQGASGSSPAASGADGSRGRTAPDEAG